MSLIKIINLKINNKIQKQIKMNKIKVNKKQIKINLIKIYILVLMTNLHYNINNQV